MRCSECIVIFVKNSIITSILDVYIQQVKHLMSCGNTADWLSSCTIDFCCKYYIRFPSRWAYILSHACKLGELWVAMVMNDKILLSAAEALFLIRKFEGICSSIFLNSFSC